MRVLSEGRCPATILVPAPAERRRALAALEKMVTIAHLDFAHLGFNPKSHSDPRFLVTFIVLVTSFLVSFVKSSIHSPSYAMATERLTPSVGKAVLKGEHRTPYTRCLPLPYNREHLITSCKHVM